MTVDIDNFGEGVVARERIGFDDMSESGLERRAAAHNQSTLNIKSNQAQSFRWKVSTHEGVTCVEDNLRGTVIANDTDDGDRRASYTNEFRPSGRRGR